ncbi:peptidylprolyl isomerase [Brevibacillus composti]|uniref:Peptidylprolyl isomerase n=1 Tax=Brevibacillus composti TaxID=2796470 RepID=A0A7T5EPM2_9BACL|nr:peptidylprolyl isomerase [Brevibacillus composti]QQE76435.1 peptidylprolyl isomerase [Brevibacillus composti]QUO43512.1 peptidylprolyl isomerase [Brevibacillus composti]
MKRSVALLSSAVLAVSLLTGCGGAAGKDSAAKPADQTQPAQNGEQATQPDDVLDQFKKLNLPYTVDPKTVLVEYQDGSLTAQEFETFLRVINFLNPMQGAMIESIDQESLKIFAREYTATKILAARAADEATQKESQELAEKTFENIKGQYMGLLGKDPSKFEQLLKNQELDQQTIIEQMVLINKSMAVLKKDINDAELKKTYEGLDKASITVASVRHILVSFEKHNNKPEEALKVANDLVARLKKGEDFAKLATENTDDPGSKESGGLYADADVSQWVPEFQDAAMKLALNEISEPVKTEYGYHIMRVESRKEKTFEEMKAQLENQALEQKYDHFNKVELDKLITKYNIPETKPAS